MRWKLEWKVSQNFQAEIERLTAEIEGGEVDVEGVGTLLSKATEATIPEKTRRGPKVRPWDDDSEIRDLLARRGAINLHDQPREYTRLTKKIRRRVRALRAEHLKSETESINLAWANRDLKRAFLLAKEHGREAGPVKTAEECKKEDQTTFFQQHFNKMTESDPQEEITTAIPGCIRAVGSIPVYQKLLHSSTPTIEELVRAIGNLKNKKSSTDAPAKCLKTAIKCKGFLGVLHRALGVVWETQQIPEVWKESKITCLFKKGDPTLPQNYRGLSVSSVLLKAIISVILTRQREYYESTISDSKMGFRQARGTTDAIWAIKSLQRVFATKKQKLF